MADRFLRSNIGWMILAAMHDCNAWLSIHESIEDLIANGLYSGQAQRFVDDRRNDRHRLSTADQRIAELIGMHFHKVGAIYNNCTCGSMLNVQLDAYSSRTGNRAYGCR